MTRPILHRAVTGATIEPADWNDNFDDTLDYIEGYLPSQTNNSGKVLLTNGVSTLWGNATTSIYVPKQTLITSTISLSDLVTLYTYTVSGNTTFVFSTANLTEKNTKVTTFELLISMSTAYTITFPSNVTWLNGDTPDMTETGNYLFAFRTIDGGTTWIGNLQGTI